MKSLSLQLLHLHCLSLKFRLSRSLTASLDALWQLHVCPPPLLDMVTRFIILKHNSDHFMPLFETTLHPLTATQPHQCHLPLSQHGLYADTLFFKYRITFSNDSLSGNTFLCSLPEKLTDDSPSQLKEFLSEAFLAPPGSHLLLLKFPIAFRIFPKNIDNKS